MSEKPTKEFEPISTQEEFDERIKARLAREREKWEKAGEVGELRDALTAKDEEIANLKREHYLKDARRAVREELARRGCVDEGRQERALKLMDLGAIVDRGDGEPSREQVLRQVDEVGRDVPELVAPRQGAGSRGSSKPVFEPEPPLTRDEVENMTEEEINSRWDQVKAFLAGER